MRLGGDDAVGGVLAVLAVSAVSASPASATSTTLYVATTGADTGNCQTAGTPCKTIGYALNQAPSGATVDIAAGTYDENLLIGGSSLAGWRRTVDDDHRRRRPEHHRCRDRGRRDGEPQPAHHP